MPFPSCEIGAGKVGLQGTITYIHLVLNQM